MAKKIEQPTAHPTEVVPVGDLRPHPRNYKKHPAEQIRHLVASLRQYGQFRNVVIAKDSTILAGHGVIEAIKKIGWAEVTCVRLDLDPASPKALKLVALDNELPRLGETDDKALALLLREVAGEDGIGGLLGTGFDAESLALLDEEGGHRETNDEEDPVVPTDALVKKWGTAPGQLWVVPSLTVPGREHRLLCGDCRDPANVERLRAGRRPKLGLHDPPYGIDAVSIPAGRTSGSVWGHAPRGAVSNRQRGNKAHRTAFAPIVDDDKPFAPAHLLASGARTLVLWGGNCFADKLPASAEWLAWVKLDDAAGECHFSSAELAWVTPPANRKGHVRRVSCLRIPGGMDGDATRYHPTQKPEKVQAAPIGWYTEPGDDVEDWYMGAGAVIIACEKLGRIGHGMDIAHAYLAATLERLSARGLCPRLDSEDLLK